MRWRTTRHPWPVKLFHYFSCFVSSIFHESLLLASSPVDVMLHLRAPPCRWKFCGSRRKFEVYWFAAGDAVCRVIEAVCGCLFTRFTGDFYYFQNTCRSPFKYYTAAISRIFKCVQGLIMILSLCSLFFLRFRWNPPRQWYFVYEKNK